jgi:hypothetical protein
MIEILQRRLDTYERQHGAGAGQVARDHAVREMLQEVALYGLWRAGFFERALFQGGTSLRILHQLPRFSEDLDFMLRVPDAAFDWAGYLGPLRETFAQFGLVMNATSKAHMDRRIRSAIVKHDAIANQLNLSFADGLRAGSVKIKLEIDVNPPPFGGEATKFLDFPLDFEVRHQDLASNFALKIHALLCRGYLKGRDWFDFGWYVTCGVAPNLRHLSAALRQAGPWSGQQELDVDVAWLYGQLADSIGRIDWREAAQDVQRFLRPTEAEALQLWSVAFFMAKLDKLRKMSQE